MVEKNHQNHQNHQVIIDDKDKACKLCNIAQIVFFFVVCIEVLLICGLTLFSCKCHISTKGVIVLVSMALIVFIGILIIGYFKRDYEKKWNLYVRNVLNKQ